MSEIVSVYATFPDMAEAERIARFVIEDRMAACVNILGPARSIYRWQGEVETAEEVVAIFKTSAEQASLLIERIAALHGYEVPGIAVWPVLACMPAYRAWVIDQVS